MSVFARMSYTIDKSNKNYINAIARYNQDVSIDEINYKDVSHRHYSGKNLPSIVAIMKGDQFGIKMTTSNSVATKGVLPAINHNSLMESIAGKITADDRECARSSAEKIKDYIHANDSGAEVNYLPPKLPNITQTRAILILDILLKNGELNGAMMFPDQQAIIFHCNYNNYIFKYSDMKSQFNKLPIMNFDIDNGFCFDRDDSEKYMEIYTKLQSFFIDWKENNYTGDVIPATQSGFKNMSEADKENEDTSTDDNVISDSTSVNHEQQTNSTNVNLATNFISISELEKIIADQEKMAAMNRQLLEQLKMQQPKENQDKPASSPIATFGLHGNANKTKIKAETSVHKNDAMKRM